MIVSWATVEVPRYLFYVAAIVVSSNPKQHKIPYPLFWLRYSLFAILYPTGIIGELTVFFAAAYDPIFIQTVGSYVPVTFLYARVLPIIYFFGSPFMIYNMILNRKSAFKKRFMKPPPPPNGLVWPIIPTSSERSSTETNKAILAAAVGAVNPTKRDAILNCSKWRFQYTKHLASLVEEQCTSPENALKIAQAGLDKAYELFEFVTPASNGSAAITQSFQDIMTKKSPPTTEPFFYTGFVQGTKPKATNQVIEVPYKGTILSGQPLKDQIQKWVDYGTIEPSCGKAMQTCIDHPEWVANVAKDRYFVLLGAGSAMGPLLVLLALGANVIAIDLDRPMIWQRLIRLAKESSGTMTFPLKIDPTKNNMTDELLCANAGCNLFTHTPMIRDWLLPLYPNKAFTIGCYAYLDGALHVQVSLAMDAICRDLSEQRKNTSLAYLCTPTDLHLIPQDAYDAQLVNYKIYCKKLYCTFLHMISPKTFLRKNHRPPINVANGETFYLVNGISVAQGPNYALAKRMQHWRAIIARNKNQCIVSSNVAPSTSTASVVHNRTFAWAYEGMPYFKPYEIFAPETSNAVMSTLLLYDISDPNSVGNPGTKLANPNQLFAYNSFHGGVWRCAYEIDSIGEASVFLYFGRLAQPYFYGTLAVTVAVTAYLYSV
jgi:Protein tyrosine phosphatase-like protein, PTPLA